MSPDLPEPASPKAGPARKPGVRRILSDAVIFLAEIILPAVLAVVVLYFLAGAVNFGSISPGLDVVFLSVAVVAISLGASVVLDSFIMSRNKKLTGKARLRLYQARLARLGLGGLLIPLLIVLAANLVPVSGKDTAMGLFIQVAIRPAQATPSVMIGNAVLNASNPSVKVQGIRALQSVHTLAAQDELVRILKEDPTALKDGTVYAALAEAIGSYGVDSKARLIEVFKQATPAAEGTTGGAAGDLYTRYLSLPVEALKAEVKAQTADVQLQGQKLAQVDAAVGAMKTAIDQLQSGDTGSGATIHEFVIVAFLASDLKQDADLINFAKEAAADPAYSDRVRGQALLLLAAQGGKDELGTLYSYLQNTSEVLQGYALQAIVATEAKTTK